MPGITAYGAYIPLHRLSRAEIARAWGGRAAPGERAVAELRRGQPHHGRGRGARLPQGRRPLHGRGGVLRLHHGALQGEAVGRRHRVGAGPAAGHGDRRLRRLAALRHQRPQGGAGRGGGRERAERAGLRRRHAPRVSRRPRRDELRGRRRGAAGRRRRDARRGRALRQPLLGDPGHLALGPGHLRAHGRGPLLDGRGLRRRHGAQRGGGPREVRAGRRRRGALRLQRSQRAPGQGRRQEAALRRADPGQRRAARVGGRHGLRREPAQPGRGAGAGRRRRDDPAGLLRQRLRHRRPARRRTAPAPCRPVAACAGTSSPGAS